MRPAIRLGQLERFLAELAREPVRSLAEAGESLTMTQPVTPRPRCLSAAFQPARWPHWARSIRCLVRGEWPAPSRTGACGVPARSAAVLDWAVDLYWPPRLPTQHRDDRTRAWQCSSDRHRRGRSPPSLPGTAAQQEPVRPPSVAMIPEKAGWLPRSPLAAGCAPTSQPSAAEEPGRPATGVVGCRAWNGRWCRGPEQHVIDHLA